MKNKTYDVLKWIGNIFLPALSVLIVALGEIWQIPYYAEISASLTAIAIFINACLKKASDDYFSNRIN